MAYKIIAFEVRERSPKFLLGVLCIIGCPVQLISEVFKITFVSTHICLALRHFAPLAYVLPHFDALTHVVIRVSSAFIFQTFAEVCFSVFVKHSCFKSLQNLCKAYIFHEFAEGLPAICVGRIFQSFHLFKSLLLIAPAGISPRR